jgi:hypothetical protein
MTVAAVRDPTSPAGQPRDELGLSPAALAALAAVTCGATPRAGWSNRRGT